MINKAFRWAVAVLATIATFAAATWISGALVLTMHDAGVRWGIAGGLGVAVAALAALWGHSYAATEDHQSGSIPAHPAEAPADGGAIRNTIRGGTFNQPVIQGRDFGTVKLTDSGSQMTPPPSEITRTQQE